MILSDQYARKLGLEIGRFATLIGATAQGGMAVQNFTLAGTIDFGVTSLNRNFMVADLADLQYALDLEDRAGEILGFFPDMVYREQPADRMARDFNRAYEDREDPFTPHMMSLSDQNDLRGAPESAANGNDHIFLGPGIHHVHRPFGIPGSCPACGVMASSAFAWPSARPRPGSFRPWSGKRRRSAWPDRFWARPWDSRCRTP